MKQFKYNTLILQIGIFLFLIMLFSACYEYPELSENQYENYRRVLGPEGGTINFYKNYEHDAANEILVKMEFPKNALDSFVVFNMYEFEDRATYVDLYYLGMVQESKFLYFVPFYESFGYNEHTDNATDEHLSINFNLPVTVTYNIGLYETGGLVSLYRIKIPGLNEWGTENNVWVNWNYQGYPDGYDNLDLTYLINGRWTDVYAWGAGPLSLDNWEEVLDYTYDSTSKTVTFNIESTDYIYVMGEFFGL